MASEGRILILRRPKSCPDKDALHCMRVGFLIFVLLSILLPAVMT
jgi:hypothetical protein